MSYAAVEACRSCGDPRLSPVLDLGEQPLANAFRAADDASPEARFPLAICFCEGCSLIQLTGTVDPTVLFDDYPYFSSVSASMVATERQLVDRLIEREDLGDGSLVVEVASNDGYLLQRYVERGIGVLGIDPAANIAEHAASVGVETLVAYFGSAVANDLVASGRRADVIHANNVIAHVPDINDFVAGMASLLAPGGTVVIETPHLVRMVENVEFDTIYHEHVFYYSLHALRGLLARHGLATVDVEELHLHGGSLRVFARHAPATPGPGVAELLAMEEELGVASLAYYAGFADRVALAGSSLVALLDELLAEGHALAGYGAAAKGTVLLNHFGIDSSYLQFVADRSPHKQGLVVPGVRIPIVSHEVLLERCPSATLLLAWNFADEIMAQQHEYAAGGGRFLVPVPEPRVVEDLVGPAA